MISHSFLERKYGALKRNSIYIVQMQGKAVFFQATHALGNSLLQDVQRYHI